MNIIDYFGTSRTKAIASDSPERIALDLMITISQSEKELADKGAGFMLPHPSGTGIMDRWYYFYLYQECLDKLKGS